MLKAQKDPAPWVITANDLRSGEVVFFDGADFSNDLNRAKLYRDKASLESALSRLAHNNDVIDLFYFGVRTDDREVTINRLRERIRDLGPTIQYRGTTQHVSL